jgi:hypothetical protein
LDLKEFTELVTFTARCLGAQEPGEWAESLTGQGQPSWTVTEITELGPGYPQALLSGPDHAQLKIKYGWGAAGKVTVYGMMPSKYGDGNERYAYAKHANVAPERGGKAIANEARRRVLNAGYLDELPGKWAEQVTEQAEADMRSGLMARAAGLFGLEAPGDAPLNLSRFLPDKRGQVELTSHGPATMNIELYGLDPEVGMAMLQVLSASHLVSTSCCYRYGPMHHPSLAVTGCLHGGCAHDEQRGELGSREAVLQYLAKSHSVPEPVADAALTGARDSRYEVAEVEDGDRTVAVVHWNTQGLGEYTVEIPRKDKSA